MLSRIEVNEGWEFKQATELQNKTAADKFYPVSQFPTVAQLDLLHQGFIPDPYVDLNEAQVLWVGEADWTYRTFDVPGVSLKNGERAVLVFEGLDTVVDVYFKNELILSAKDMFLTYRVDVTKHLSGHSGSSSLELRFKSNILASRRERDRIGSNGSDKNIHFGGSERLFLRKAQYHWGWDWGPALNTSGPFGSIYFEKYSARIEDVQVAVDVPKSLSHADITISGTVECAKKGNTVLIELKSPSGVSIADSVVDVDHHNRFKVDFKVHNPELWYPYMYGDQPLYSVTVTLNGDLDSVSKSFGIRRLRLVEKSLLKDLGLSFTFEVNNVSVFCGGSNWIPGDCLLPRMTNKRYESWIKLAKAGNQTMIRVWGGGIFETEAFYNTCDKEGILVWQDFLFACGNYPASPDFVNLIKQEITQQVKRATHHPSLVLLCGNNEDYLLANRFGWEWDIDDKDGPWDNTDFPARLIYEKVIPTIVDKLAPNIPYWWSSPYGGRYANDPSIGDVHIWDVWHGEMSPYQQYIDYMGKFVSEFGFESAPSIRTLHKGITDPKERHSQSRTFDAHDKGPGNQRRYGMYLSENYRFRMSPLEDYVYCSQLLQAEAMSYACTLFRREFRGPGNHRCSGSLVWQLNDIWYGQSWALVDVDMNPKPAFYSLKHALAPLIIGLGREVTKEPSYVIRSYPQEKARGVIWGISTSTKEENMLLDLKAYDIESGVEVNLQIDVKTVKLQPNQTTELGDFHIPNDTQTVVVAYFRDVNDHSIKARFVSWPEPFKFVRFAQDPKITIDSSENGVISVSSNVPLKGVVLSVPLSEGGNDAQWGDNYIDIVPGQVSKFPVEQLDGRSVKARWLCDWESEPRFTSV